MKDTRSILATSLLVGKTMSATRDPLSPRPNTASRTFVMKLRREHFGCFSMHAINVVVHARTYLLAQLEETVVEKRELARSLEEGEEIGRTRVRKSKQCSRNA